MHERGTHEPSIHTIQIIVAALMVGVISFAAVAVFLRLQQPADQGLPMISYIMAAISLPAVLGRFVVPGFLAAAQRKNCLHDNEEEQRTQFLGLYQTTSIIANALTEGAAFACLVAFIVEGQWWLLAIVAGILVLMAGAFPTPGRFESFYRTHRELAEMQPR